MKTKILMNRDSRESLSNTRTERNSGIELLKIIAIFLIVISHVVQTLGSEHDIVSTEGTFLNLSVATSNIKYLVLMLCRYFGPIGNDVFIICSAWFLCDSKKAELSKVFRLIFDVWVVNVGIMAVFLLSGIGISKTDILHSFFPTTFENNWYITCYLLLFMIHPLLNIVIDKLSQKQMFAFVFVTFLLYSVICTIKSEFFYFSGLIFFIVVYFMIAYIKKYMYNFTESKKQNLLCMVIGALGLIVFFIVTNSIVLKTGILDGKILYWKKNQNPFCILLCIALFNLFKNINFKNKFINSVSSITLLIYIIHENILIRGYLRPRIFVLLHDKLGYDYILLLVLLFSVCLFIVSVLIGFLYKYTVQKITKRVSLIVSDTIKKLFNKLFCFIKKIT